MLDFTEIRPQAVELFKNSLEELTKITSPDGTRQAYHQNIGYITGLNRLGVLNDAQYAAMISLLGSTMNAKKVAPGVGSTESDKVKSINFSLEQNLSDVKSRPDAFVHADIYSGTNLHMEMYGEIQKLLAILACYTLDLRKNGVPESEIQKAYIESFMSKEGKTNA